MRYALLPTASIAIISLALGIGANAAIYSLFDQTLLRPPPVAAPNELVNLNLPAPIQGNDSCNRTLPMRALRYDGVRVSRRSASTRWSSRL